MSVNLISPEGKAVSVPEDQVAGYLAQKFTVEETGQAIDRATAEQKEVQFSGIDDKIATVVTRGVGSATLGLSDAILSELGQGAELDALRDVNPELATVGTIAGAILPGLIPGAGFLPAGAASKLGARIAGAGKGAIGKVAASAGGAATEGALQNAGAYITDVALGDRELSADGFIGAMGKGGLYGGVAGGALAVGAGALTAARRLFPAAEMTAANVAKAERAAIDDVAASLDDAANLQASAREQLAQRRAAMAAADPEIAAKMDAIKAAKQREIFARAETAESRAVAAEARAAKAKTAAEKASAPKAPRAGRKAASDVAEEVVADAAPAPTAAPPVSVADDLMAQLQGTKRGLDEGVDLATMGAPKYPPKPTGRTRSPELELEDELNRVVAEADPGSARLVAVLDESQRAAEATQAWLAKYKGSAVGKLDRKMATEDWIANARNKGDGWQNVVPEGEGNAVLRRGRQMEWRGSDEGRKAAEDAINAKVTPAERAAAEEAADRMFGSGRARAIADDVVDATPRADVDSALETALKSKVDDIDDDIADAATTITRQEAALADLADELGPMASPAAQGRAKAVRDAQRSAEQRTAQATANAAEDIDKAVNTVSLPGAKGAGREGLSRATDAATAWEALHMMGVPMPDPRDIPVIGPALSLFLKARVLGKAFGRFGGKVAETAETAIASKAASTQQRAYAAIDNILDGTSKALGRAAGRSGGAAAALGHVLFDDAPAGERKAYTSEPKGGELLSNFQARADELSKAQAPGAVRAAVRDRVRATDPAIVDAIVAAEERKLGFLFDKMPKADAPSVMTGRQWMPSRFAIGTFAKYVEAANDPAAVLEQAASGQMVSLEAAETLRVVYPRLYQEAQKRLIEQATTGEKTIPFKRRVQLSILFDLPMDASMSPEYAFAMQEPYQAQAISQQAAQPPPGQPTIAGPVNLAAPADPYTR